MQTSIHDFRLTADTSKISDPGSWILDTRCYNPVSSIRHRTSFFTLIELLIVIAIIAVLIALLLPALNQAKETAKKVVCMGNQKQLSLLLGSYQSDFEMYSPGAVSTINYDAVYYWSRYIDGSSGGSGGAVADSYYEGNAYVSNTIFRCPKNFQADTEESNIYGMYYTARYASEDTLFMEEYAPVAGTRYYHFVITRMPSPASFLMLGCTLKGANPSHISYLRGAPKFCRDSVDSTPPVNTMDGLWFAHKASCTGLFADGHAVSMDSGILTSTRNGYKTDVDTGIRAWKLYNGTEIDLYP